MYFSKIRFVCSLSECREDVPLQIDLFYRFCCEKNEEAFLKKYHRYVNESLKIGDEDFFICTMVPKKREVFGRK